MPAATDGTKFTTASADTAIVDKLRDQFAAGKFDRILGGKKERVIVEAFYASRDFAPLWIADGAISARGKAAATFLAGVDAERPAMAPHRSFEIGARLALEEIRHAT